MVLVLPLTVWVGSASAWRPPAFLVTPLLLPFDDLLCMLLLLFLLSVLVPPLSPVGRSFFEGPALSGARPKELLSLAEPQLPVRKTSPPGAAAPGNCDEDDDDEDESSDPRSWWRSRDRWFLNGDDEDQGGGELQLEGREFNELSLLELLRAELLLLLVAPRRRCLRRG